MWGENNLEIFVTSFIDDPLFLFSLKKSHFQKWQSSVYAFEIILVLLTRSSLKRKFEKEERERLRDLFVTTAAFMWPASKWSAFASHSTIGLIQEPIL